MTTLKIRNLVIKQLLMGGWRHPSSTLTTSSYNGAISNWWSESSADTSEKCLDIKSKFIPNSLELILQVGVLFFQIEFRSNFLNFFWNKLISNFGHNSVSALFEYCFGGYSILQNRMIMFRFKVLLVLDLWKISSPFSLRLIFAPFLWCRLMT